jgi:hypothetical protein
VGSAAFLRKECVCSLFIGFIVGLFLKVVGLLWHCMECFLLPKPEASIMARASRALSSVAGMKAWPPKPGFTLIKRMMSSLSITYLQMSSGVAGLNTRPALHPQLRISWGVQKHAERKQRGAARAVRCQNLGLPTHEGPQADTQHGEERRPFLVLCMRCRCPYGSYICQWKGVY